MRNRTASRRDRDDVLERAHIYFACADPRSLRPGVPGVRGDTDVALVLPCRYLAECGCDIITGFQPGPYPILMSTG